MKTVAKALHRRVYRKAVKVVHYKKTVTPKVTRRSFFTDDLAKEDNAFAKAAYKSCAVWWNSNNGVFTITLSRRP